MNQKQVIEALQARNTIMLKAFGEILAHLLKVKDAEGCKLVSETMAKLLEP